MSDENKQHQGEPVAYLITPPGCSPALVFARDIGRPSKYTIPLYTHADHGEVERLRSMFDQTNADLRSVTAERDTLRAQLDERDSFIHDLEANCDPAGTVRENVLFRDQLKQVNAMVARLKSELAEAHALLQQVWKEADCSRIPDEWHKRIVALALSASAEQKAKDPN